MTIYGLLKDTWKLNIPDKCIIQNIKGGVIAPPVYAYDVYNYQLFNTICLYSHSTLFTYTYFYDCTNNEITNYKNTKC